MRKRKRDWPVAVYKFWARPLELPQEMWETADAMRGLWNRLVALYEDAQLALDTLPEADRREISAQADSSASRVLKNPSAFGSTDQCEAV